MKGNIRSIMLTTCLIVFMTLALCEVVSRIIFHSKDVRNSIQEIQASINTVSQEKKLNPFWILNSYYGFNHTPGLSPLYLWSKSMGGLDKYSYPLGKDAFELRYSNIHANNYGFFACDDYPYTSDNEYIIGILGGSVATFWWCMCHEEAEMKLSEKLGRPVKILDFALGAAKEPQQLMILSYFLSIGQKFDMIINLNGYNEVANSLRNFDTQFVYSFPTAYILNPYTTDMNFTVANAEIILAQKKMQSISGRLNFIEDINSRVLHSRFISYLCHRVFNKFHSDLIEKQNKIVGMESTTGNMFLVPEHDNILDSKKKIKLITDLWIMSSKVISDICKSNNILYYEFIQPSQYHTTKKFTDYEKQYCIDKNWEKWIIEYPNIINNVLNFHKNDIQMVNLATIFDNEEEEIYVDMCCHVNYLGNSIITDHIVDYVINDLKSKNILQ